MTDSGRTTVTITARHWRATSVLRLFIYTTITVLRQVAE
jgi:hypothetical protein